MCLPAAAVAAPMFFGYDACQASVIVQAVGFGVQQQVNSQPSSGGVVVCGETAGAGLPGASGTASVQGGAGFIGAAAQAASGASPDKATADGGANFVDWLEVMDPGAAPGTIVPLMFTVDLHGSFTGDGEAVATLDVEGGSLFLQAMDSQATVDFGLNLTHVTGTTTVPVNTFFEVQYSLGAGAHNGSAGFFNTALYHIDAPDGLTLTSLSGHDYSSTAPSSEAPEPGTIWLSLIGVCGALLASRKLPRRAWRG